MRSLENIIKDVIRGLRVESKKISVEHASRNVMEKKTVSEFERQLHDAQKHMNANGVSLNPNLQKLEKDQTASDSPAIDKETDKSVADISPEAASTSSMVDTPKDDKDNNITDTTPGVGKLGDLEKANRVIRIRNIRAQNKTKIIDNA